MMGTGRSPKIPTRWMCFRYVCAVIRLLQYGISILPERFLDNIRDVQGLELDRFSTAHEQPPVISVRKHPVKKSEAFDNNEQVPWCNAGRYLEKRPVFTLDPF